MSARMAALATMPNRDIDGVLFDVDDTITTGGRLRATALAALERLEGAGVARVAISGRSLGFAELWARQWPVDMAIGENGAASFRMDADGVAERWFEPDEAQRDVWRQALQALEDRVRDALPSLPLADDAAYRRADLAWDLTERYTASDQERSALRRIVESAGMRYVASSVHAHAVPGPWDKASGAFAALDAHLGVDAERARARWVFVGDSGNDAAAFAAFPRSIGVANVREHLSGLETYPAFVSTCDRADGFAEIVDHLLGGQ